MIVSSKKLPKKGKVSYTIIGTLHMPEVDNKIIKETVPNRRFDYVIAEEIPFKDIGKYYGKEEKVVLANLLRLTAIGFSKEFPVLEFEGLAGMGSLVYNMKAFEKTLGLKPLYYPKEPEEELYLLKRLGDASNVLEKAKELSLDMSVVDALSRLFVKYIKRTPLSGRVAVITGAYHIPYIASNLDNVELVAGFSTEMPKGKPYHVFLYRTTYEEVGKSRGISMGPFKSL